MKRKHLKYFLILFLGLNTVQAQNQFILKEIPAKYKLKEDYIRKFYTDSSGIVWMRTFSRVLRYTGNELEDFDPIIPPDFRLQDLYMLGNRILLNYNHEELKLFDIKNLNLINISLPANSLPVNHISFTDKEHIYLSSKKQQKVFRCALRNNELIIISVIENLEVDKLIPLNDSLFMYELNLNLYHRNTLSRKNNLIVSQAHIHDFSISDSTISLTMTGYFLCFDFLHLKILKNIYNLKEEGFNIRYNGGKQWVFTTGGIYLYDLTTLQEERCEFNLSNEFLYVNNNSFDICYQREGDYYLLSTQGGLFKMTRVVTTSIRNIDLAKMVLANNELSLRCINYNETNEEVYTSINLNGIYSFQLTDSTLRESFQFKTIQLNNIQEKNLNKIFIDNLKRIWLLGNTRTLLTKSKEILANLDLKSWDITQIKNQFWIIDNDLHSPKVYKLDSNGYMLKSFRYKNDDNQNSLWDIEPYNNYLFISSIEGLITFDMEKEVFVDTKTVLKTYEDLKGRAWSSKVIGKFLYIAYQDKGLKKINLETGEISNPLPFIKKAFQIESCDGKNIWVNAQDKIIYLEENGKYFILKTSNFALPSEIAFHGMYADSASNLWVCGKGGFSRINTIELLKKIKSIAIKTIICDMSINNVLTAGNISDRSTFEFPYDSNNITLKIANNLLDNNEDLKIKYMLIGYDKTYSETDNINSITYKNLPYGNYTLSIFVCSSLGLWEEIPTQLFININPPWYFSKIAKLVYSLIIIGLIYLVYFIFKQRFEKRKKQELMFIESELKALRSQLNPHFLFNSLNSILSHILNKETEVATLYLNKFAKLLRKVLEFSSLEAITLKEEIDWIEEYLNLEALRFDNKLKWHFIGLDSIPPTTRIPALVIQPVIENSIIHGLFPKKDGGTINLIYSQAPDNKTITITIEDDGVGRKESSTSFFKDHNSKGTLITTKRLEYLSKRYETDCSFEIKDLYNSKGLSMGTSVTMVLPVI